jgi:hypothetical protein
MFGLPVEVTVGMLSTLGGFAMKLMAQKAANQHELIKIAKRSSPWLRKFAAITVLLVAFVGIFIVAFIPSVPVSIVQDAPQKSLLWGLVKWGKQTEVIIANGFVIADWFKYSVISIVFFLFGTGAAKTK